jgi:hypothetical protein
MDHYIRKIKAQATAEEIGDLADRISSMVQEGDKRKAEKLFGCFLRELNGSDGLRRDFLAACLREIENIYDHNGWSKENIE